MRVKHFISVFLMLFTLSVNFAWGDPSTIYSNTGATGTTDGITASGNINTKDSNGNPAPCFGLTNASYKTITITGLNLASYTNISLVLDRKLSKNSQKYSSLTVTQYNSQNQSIGTDNVTGNDQNYHTSNAISINSACVKITIVCNPANGSTYNTFVDNIIITGTPSSTCNNKITISKATPTNGSNI